jgi:2-iminobutanoate/2-iminopropanoate deaminase
MRLEIVSPEGIFGDRPFAPAVRVDGATSVLFVSGQLGEDASGVLVSTDVAEQATQCFRNIDLLLRAAGATKEDVAKLTIYLTDLADREAVARARTAFFGEQKPATTAVVVEQLVVRGAKIEVEAVAMF